MFTIFSSRHRLSDYSALGVDIHSHVLPGLDDGARDVSQSLLLIGGLGRLGFTTVYSTPHVSSELYPNTPADIAAGLDRLLPDLRESNGSIVVSAAAEYLLDELFNTLLAGRQLMNLPGNRLLVELPFIAPSPQYERTLFEMRVAGYRPVLAHPERYPYLAKDPHVVARLRAAGCDMQVNILSLLGYYGGKVRTRAYDLVASRVVDFLATDLHNQVQLSVLEQGLQDSRLAKLFKKYTFLNQALN